MATSDVARRLAARGVSVPGIDLSADVLAQLRAKPGADAGSQRSARERQPELRGVLVWWVGCGVAGEVVGWFVVGVAGW